MFLLNSTYKCGFAQTQEKLLWWALRLQSFDWNRRTGSSSYIPSAATLWQWTLGLSSNCIEQRLQPRRYMLKTYDPFNIPILMKQSMYQALLLRISALGFGWSLLGANWIYSLCCWCGASDRVVVLQNPKHKYETGEVVVSWGYEVTSL